MNIIVHISTFLQKLFIHKTENKYVQFFRYGFVSLAALIVDFGGLILLKEAFHVNYIVSATISFTGGLIINYLLSKAWVFQESRFQSKSAEFALFAGIGIVGLVLNDVILWAMTGVFGVFYVLSKLAATAVVFFWNFGARKVLVFK